MAPKSLLREPLKKFKPYVAGKPIEEVRREYGLEGRIAKLASNENPLGTSPMALEAMRKAIEEVALYPDDNSYYYRMKVAERYGVGIENVFGASGSVEILELCGVAFINPGDVIVTSEKSFAIYNLVAAKFDAELRLSKMGDGGFRYDLEAMADLLDENVKIVFLANPTNPTGTWFTADEFDAFMSRVHEDTLVVYDSAYEEYVTEPNMPDPMKYFHDGRRIMLSRTFSKAVGLAGVRVGFGVAPADIIRGLMTVRFPFNVNLVAQRAAMAAMDDKEFIEKTRTYNNTELAFMRQGLDGLPIMVPPSQTNFLFIDTDKNAQWLFEEMQKQGVIVRPIGAKAIRVNTGLREDNERFLRIFRELILSDEGKLG